MSDQQPTIKEQRNLKQEMKEQRRRSQAQQEKVKNIVTWSIVGVVAAGIVALVVLSKTGTTATNANVAPVTSDDHIAGATTAPAVLIEYSDFQCPACGAYYPVVKNLQQKYGDKLTLVYRNYPLTSLHIHAQLAAQAAEAANLQGKYWDMHDLLFENQNSWSTANNDEQTFVDYAKQLGLDTTKFKNDLNSDTVKNRVARDVSSGDAVGVSATPTFFLNGKKLSNPSSEDAFSKLIDGVLPATNS